MSSVSSLRSCKPALYALSLALLSVCLPAHADAEFELIIQNHQFQPAELKVPAGEKFKLIVKNQDATPEEFESHELNREKVIPGGSKASILIGPLKPGSYPFFGEFHEATAQGKLIAE